MKSEKTEKVAIQFKNNIHNQERDKTQKKTQKIQATRVLKAGLKTKHRGHLNKSN